MKKSIAGEAMDASTFRNSLTEARMTQAAFARRLGKNVRTVNRWAKGYSPVPLVAVLALQDINRKRSEIWIRLKTYGVPSCFPQLVKTFFGSHP